MIRYRVSYVETIKKTATVDVDLPRTASHKDIYDAARKAVVAAAKEREKDVLGYFPNLTLISAHILGEVPDVPIEDSTAQRESGERVLASGQEAAGGVGEVDVSAESRPDAT